MPTLTTDTQDSTARGPERRHRMKQPEPIPYEEGRRMIRRQEIHLQRLASIYRGQGIGVSVC